MKITIDTKEDSPEELKKVIRMLSSIIGEEVMSNQGDIFSSESPSESPQDNSQPGTPDIFNMFNSDSETKTTEESDKKGEKDDDLGINMPELEEYDD